MSGAALLVIDMQRVYAPGGAWATPGFDRAEANILRLCRRYPRRLFTRHLPFSDPPGTWNRYNAEFAGINRDPECARLVPALEALGHLSFEKQTYSALSSGALRAHLLAADYAEILMTGVQSEFCVLATLMDAVDLGLPVTLVWDACAGSSPALDAALHDIAALMPCQVRLATTEEVLNG